MYTSHFWKEREVSSETYSVTPAKIIFSKAGLKPYTHWLKSGREPNSPSTNLTAWSMEAGLNGGRQKQQQKGFQNEPKSSSKVVVVFKHAQLPLESFRVDLSNGSSSKDSAYRSCCLHMCKATIKRSLFWISHTPSHGHLRLWEMLSAPPDWL